MSTAPTEWIHLLHCSNS